MSESLKRTPLYQAHVDAGARLVDFGGWEMPVQYTSMMKEHRQVRESVGLFDVSHMGEVRLRGARALEAARHLVTNRMDIAIGQAQYSPMCNEKGGIVDDLIVYNMADDDVLICVNAANRVKDLAWIQAHNPFDDVAVVDESDDWGQIAVQGRHAPATLQAITDVDLSAVRYYWHASGTVAGVDGCIIARTGYTGEDGFEVFVPEAHTRTVWDALLEAGGDTSGLKGLSETRRVSLVPGVAIMRAVFAALRVDRMVVSDGALREGLLSELVGRLHHQDNRDATVLAMAERFSVDMEQAGRVASTGALLFEAVRRPWAARRSRAGLLLRWAALLHELGLSVSHDAYRRHGSYLIANADLPGLSRNEQERLAEVVQAQRGRLGTERWSDFREEVRREVLVAVLLLRVARILHRSRSSRPLPAWRPKGTVAEDGALTLDLGIPDAWRAEHPLTTADLEAEALLWSELGHGLVV